MSRGPCGYLMMLKATLVVVPLRALALGVAMRR